MGERQTEDLKVLCSIHGEEFACSHPGLSKLRKEPKLFWKYVRFIVLRIFFDTAKQYRDRIYLEDFKENQKLVECFFLVTDSSDLQSGALPYFGLNEFNAIHEKFEDICTDKEGNLTLSQVCSYNNGNTNTRILARMYDIIKPIPRSILHGKYESDSRRSSGNLRAHNSDLSAGSVSSDSHTDDESSVSSTDRSLLRKVPRRTQGRTTSSSSPVKKKRHSFSTHREDRLTLTPEFGFEEFLYLYMLLEEATPSGLSLSLWAKCCDVDDDGFLGTDDLHYFYDYLIYKMESCLLEPIPFEKFQVFVCNLRRPPLPIKIPFKEIHNEIALTLYKTLTSYEKFLELIYRIVYPQFKTSATFFLPSTFTPLPTPPPLLANFTFIQERPSKPKLTSSVSSSNISITLTRNPSFGGLKRNSSFGGKRVIIHTETIHDKDTNTSTNTSASTNTNTKRKNVKDK
eukprot:TRINITY_DN2906_c0_g1_i1.p1 TRINITY_DN2906_c0_g1~~TRINITY_DN2906_c0_g1_i1.p1  ORF type:complete len:456 (-),score=51.01 TRINITY_DN2906_c0_g1_i1:22-1389(-)